MNSTRIRNIISRHNKALKYGDYHNLTTFTAEEERVYRWQNIDEERVYKDPMAIFDSRYNFQMLMNYRLFNRKNKHHPQTVISIKPTTTELKQLNRVMRKFDVGESDKINEITHLFESVTTGYEVAGVPNYLPDNKITGIIGTKKGRCIVIMRFNNNFVHNLENNTVIWSTEVMSISKW